MSAMLTRTRSAMPSMLNGLPPASGRNESTRSTSAPSATNRCARLEPMKPRPPVTINERPDIRTEVVPADHECEPQPQDVDAGLRDPSEVEELRLAERAMVVMYGY